MLESLLTVEYLRPAVCRDCHSVRFRIYVPAKKQAVIVKQWELVPTAVHGRRDRLYVEHRHGRCKSCRERYAIEVHINRGSRDGSLARCAGQFVVPRLLIQRFPPGSLPVVRNGDLRYIGYVVLTCNPGYVRLELSGLGRRIPENRAGLTQGNA